MKASVQLKKQRKDSFRAVLTVVRSSVRVRQRLTGWGGNRLVFPGHPSVPSTQGCLVALVGDGPVCLCTSCCWNEISSKAGAVGGGEWVGQARDQRGMRGRSLSHNLEKIRKRKKKGLGRLN